MNKSHTSNSVTHIIFIEVRSKLVLPELFLKP